MPTAPVDEFGNLSLVDGRDILSNWRAPRLTLMKPALAAPYDPFRIWEREDEAMSMTVRAEYRNRAVLQLEGALEKEAGNAALKLAMQPNRSRDRPGRGESQKEVPSSAATGDSQSNATVKSTRKVGRTVSTHMAKFYSIAGVAWRAKQGKNGRVSVGNLLSIARELDAAGLVPPKDYLGKKESEQLREYNRQNAPTKRGAISTWDRLVENHDNDHLRPMRKILSRSAKIVDNQFLD